MVFKDYGNNLISKDLRRLKKLGSLSDDLDLYFLVHKNRLKDIGFFIS